MIRKYLREHGGGRRDEILVPDSAHGTNPASAAMAGFKVVKVPSDASGLVRAKRSQGAGLRKDRRDDVHRPEHPRALRERGRRGLRSRPRCRRTDVLRRRKHECPSGEGASGRHGLRRSPPEPPQDLRDSSRRRGPRGWARSASREAGRVPPGPGRLARGKGRYSLDYGLKHSIGPLKGFVGTRPFSCGPTCTSASWGSGLSERLVARRCSRRTTSGRASTQMPSRSHTGGTSRKHEAVVSVKSELPAGRSRWPRRSSTTACTRRRSTSP